MTDNIKTGVYIGIGIAVVGVALSAVGFLINKL